MTLVVRPERLGSRSARDRIDPPTSARHIIGSWAPSSRTTTPTSFELKVTEEEDRTVVEARLEQTAEQCYRLFSDADHIAEWLVVVGTVVVRRRDDRGRALEVDFLGSLERASVAYTLSYEYDDPQLEVRWRHGAAA